MIYVLNVHVIMGITVKTIYMIKKLNEKKNGMVIVLDYDQTGEFEPQKQNGALYCSPMHARMYIEKADHVLFHRYAFVLPKLSS